MSDAARTIATNARWELTRLRRSQRIWLFLIPVVAGPAGSSIADVYLRVPSVGTAEVLGLLVTAGLGALVVLDLTALAVGEELALRTHFLTFVLPQGRGSALTGRLLVIVAGSLGSYAVGAAVAWGLAPLWVTTQPDAATPIFVASHLFLSLLAFLLFLGGSAGAAAAVTRSSAQGLVAGVLAGVVAAGGAAFLLVEHQLSYTFPSLLAVGGLIGLVVAVARYRDLDA